MLEALPDYSPTNPSLWQGRQDSLPGERYFQKVRCHSLNQQALSKEKQSIFLGFASDTGVLRNEGRPGAKYGPDQIRAQLAKLPCHLNRTYLDIGNISCEENNLEASQQQFAQLIDQCHSLGHRTLAFGGGHEIAWPHFEGLVNHYPSLAIINFDAHFDLRPLQNNIRGTSGTGFYQMAQYCQNHQLPFSYCCLGIQSLANTKSLFDQAKALQTRFLTAEEINEKSLALQLAFLDEFMQVPQYIYLSICMDVFAECFAPGVSAPQALGLGPWQVIPLLKYIMQTGKVVSIDIAELSPPLDHGGNTARLAAILAATLLDSHPNF